MKTQYLFYARKFLNKAKHESSAHILAEITKDFSDYVDQKTKKKKKYVHRNASISIADCSRIITLCMDMESKSACKNSLKKLDTLIDVLIEFKKVFVKEMEEI